MKKPSEYQCYACSKNLSDRQGTYAVQINESEAALVHRRCIMKVKSNGRVMQFSRVKLSQFIASLGKVLKETA